MAGQFPFNQLLHFNPGKLRPAGFFLSRDDTKVDVVLITQEESHFLDWPVWLLWLVHAATLIPFLQKSKEKMILGIYFFWRIGITRAYQRQDD